MSDTPVQELALEASHDKAGFSFLLARINWKRTFFIVLGVVLFTIVYYSPPWPDAVDPMGEHFPLSKEAKGALAVFLLAGIWWVFEVVPIGVTSITIGVMQSMFLIRTASQAFKDFMDPSVWFIFGSIVIGMVFTKTGLTRRLAYKMLSIVGEKTSMIYLGCFLVTAALTHVMAHTAVAATVYPLLLTIYSLYGEGERPTKFGKGLFIGMAYVAGAGSIVTLLGAARGAVAIGFFKGIVGREVTFFELTYYMFPIGWIMVFVLWGFFMIFFKPEKKTIPGLREKAKTLQAQMGGITGKEVLTILIVVAVIIFLSLQSFIPALKPFNKSAVILIATILFYLTKILDLKDLEEIPWNIILLFGGAMSIGFCLWETGAAKWLACHVHWLLFVGNGRGQMAGSELADYVPEGKLVRFRLEHCLFRDDNDQFHHERCSHRHFTAGGPGDRSIPRSRSRGCSVCLPGHRWYALPALGGSGTKCYCL